MRNALRNALLVAIAGTCLQAQDFFEGMVGQGRSGSGWTVNAGAVVLSTPQYPGSEERRLLPLPALFADYNGRWFFGSSRVALGLGVGYRMVRWQGFTWDVGVGWGEGRPERRADALAGMGDRSGSVWGGTNLGYRLGPLGARLNLVRAIGSEGGTRGLLGLGYQVRLAPNWGLGFNAQAGFADATNLAWDFGVSPEQALRRSQLIAQGDSRLRPGDGQPFRPGAGLRELSLGFSLNHSLDSRWRAFLFTGANRLSGEVTTSPLVRKSTYLTGGLGALYTF